MSRALRPRVEALEEQVQALARDLDRLRAERKVVAAWLSRNEAAAYIGAPVETFTYYVYRLRLVPIYKRGEGRGHVAFKREDLDRLMRRVSAGAPLPAETERSAAGGER